MSCGWVIASAIIAACPVPLVFAQEQTATPPAITQDDDPDRDVNLSQPDFTLAALPTTLRVPRHRSSFRITHRFGRPLNQGSFGDLLGDLFGLDQGALIGLEYRFGLWSGLQAAVHRSSDKTIQFMGQYNIRRQSDDTPIGLDLLLAVEGGDNFSEHHAPTIGVLLSRELGDRGALYVEPMFVNNSNPLPGDLVEDNSTFMVGLGARLRIRPSVYLMFEGTPRVSGFDPGVHQVSVGIERRAGGHLFQLNFSNGLGTTFGQLARGGFKSAGSDDWHLGFNISRKFF
ncbi:MAG TPA: DUF5777 family beta-barrel protein [Vicinamibacterales bacterium]|nr:DUF5777 family beta-barrel protein [Vicinamibacterales bacterium]